MDRSDVKQDWIGLLLMIIGAIWVLLPPHLDPLIRAKERREFREPRYDPERGWDRGHWWLFVGAIIFIASVVVGGVKAWIG